MSEEALTGEVQDGRRTYDEGLEAHHRAVKALRSLRDRLTLRTEPIDGETLVELRELVTAIEEDAAFASSHFSTLKLRVVVLRDKLQDTQSAKIREAEEVDHGCA